MLETTPATSGVSRRRSETRGAGCFAFPGEMRRREEANNPIFMLAAAAAAAHRAKHGLERPGLGRTGAQAATYMYVLILTHPYGHSYTYTDTDIWTGHEPLTLTEYCSLVSLPPVIGGIYFGLRLTTS